MSTGGKVMEFAGSLARARDLHRAGRIAEAEALYATLVVEKPDDPDLLFLLGIVAHQKGDQAAAGRYIERAIAGDGTRANFWRNLAVVRDAAGDKGGALAAARRAVALAEGDADNWGLLGGLLVVANGDLDEAESALGHALKLAPGHPDARCNLAGVFIKRGRDEDAESLLRGVLADQPESPTALHNLALLMWSRGEFEKGLEWVERALTAQPGWDEALLLRGVLFGTQGRLDEAIAEFRRLIAVNPNYAEAHWSMARVLLLKGDLFEGWREHEWRWRRGEMEASQHGFSAPQWNGSPLDGRTILLRTEQGIGDAIQFLRYVPMVKAAGAGRVILECEKKLHVLFGSAEGVDELVAKGERLPPFDYHVPLGSLPLVFGTVPDTIPAPIRYLAAEPARISAWGARLASLPRPRVGLCWQGNSHYKGDRLRSIPLATLAPLLLAASGSFVNLHRGIGEDQIEMSGLAGRLTVFPDMDGGGQAFTDTAAIIENLDLVITSDTSIAHLAGALGRPTWTMLPFAPDWRWQLNRENSPWYPTMRLFRQRISGDWADVVARLSQAFVEMFGEISG